MNRRPFFSRSILYGFLFFFILFGSKISAQNNIDTLIQYLFSGMPEIDPQLKLLQTKENHYILQKILSYGNKAIPYLIEVIDVDNQYIDYHGALSSTLYSDYYGIVCVKIIEKIINKNFQCENIYKDQKYCRLSLEDMKTIKLLYIRWWEENKQYSKREIRQQRKKRDAFQGSIYSWENCNRDYQLSSEYY